MKAVPMKRNQIIDTVYLIQREVWVDSVGIRGMRNEPSTTYPALEFITVKSVCAIHDKLKVVECALLSVDCRSCCVIRIGFVKPRKYALLFRSFEVEFPSLFGIGRFSLVFLRNLFPLAEGECGKANVSLMSQALCNVWSSQELAQNKQTLLCVIVCSE